MLVFCILASTCTVIFSGEETVASEANGPAFCTIVQKWVSSFTYISHSGYADKWLAWDDYSHSTFITCILLPAKEQSSREAMEHSPAWLL